MFSAVFRQRVSKLKSKFLRQLRCFSYWAIPLRIGLHTKLLNKKKYLGYKGEYLAAGLLSKKGMSILAQNWQCPVGELDLVAQHKHSLVFVEVKTRLGNSVSQFPAFDAVDEPKEEKIERAANWYMRHQAIFLKRRRIRSSRYDIIAVEFFKSKWGHRVVVQHEENAW